MQLNLGRYTYTAHLWWSQPYIGWKWVLRGDLYKALSFTTYRVKANSSSLIFAVLVNSFMNWPLYVFQICNEICIFVTLGTWAKLQHSLDPPWLSCRANCVQAPEASWLMGEIWNTGDCSDQRALWFQVFCLYDNSIFKNSFKGTKAHISNGVEWGNGSLIVCIVMPTLILQMWWISVHRREPSRRQASLVRGSLRLNYVRDMVRACRFVSLMYYDFFKLFVQREDAWKGTPKTCHGPTASLMTSTWYPRSHRCPRHPTWHSEWATTP